MKATIDDGRSLANIVHPGRRDRLTGLGKRDSGSFDSDNMGRAIRKAGQELLGPRICNGRFIRTPGIKPSSRPVTLFGLRPLLINKPEGVVIGACCSRDLVDPTPHADREP